MDLNIKQNWNRRTKEGGDKEENRPDIVVKRVTKLPSSSLRSDVYNSKQPALLHPPTLIKPILTLNLTPEERMIGVKTATAASSCPPPHSPPYPDVLSERHCVCRVMRKFIYPSSVRGRYGRLRLNYPSSVWHSAAITGKSSYFFFSSFFFLSDVDFKKNLTRVLLTAV